MHSLSTLRIVSFALTLPQLGFGVLLLGGLQFLTALLVSERLKASLQKENARFLESLRWDLKVREQSAKVAEYMALARDLRESDLPEQFRRANQLSWELALWLPPDLYRSVGRAIAAPDEETNPLSVVVDVRRLLLGSAAGDLMADHITHHGPGVGRSRKHS